MFEKDRYCQMPNGYEETVRKGLSAVKRFSGQISYGNGSDREQMDRLKKELETADAIVIGASAGLSTSAGFTYSGQDIFITTDMSTRQNPCMPGC